LLNLLIISNPVDNVIYFSIIGKKKKYIYKIYYYIQKAICVEIIDTV